MNVNNMLSHGDIPMCQIWFAYVDLAQIQIHGDNMILMLRPKVKVMNVCDTSSHGETLMCQIRYDLVCQKTKKLRPEHKATSQTFEVKGQSCIGIMNVRNTTSYMDHECTRYIISWWYTHVPNMVSQCQSRTRICILMDRETNRQSDPYIPP